MNHFGSIRQVVFLPLAIEMARRTHDGKTGQKGADALYEFLNVPLEDGEWLLNEFLSEGSDPEMRWALLEGSLISHIGDARFRRAVEEMFETPWIEPVVIVPKTAHYCWRRSAGLFWARTG